MSLSVDKFGFIEIFEGEETRTDFEDMDEKMFNEIFDKFESEISLLEQDRDYVKKRYNEENQKQGEDKEEKWLKNLN